MQNGFPDILSPIARQWARNVLANSPILPIAATSVAVIIFVLDTVTDLEIAVAVFYVAVVLMSVNFCQKRGVALVALGCMALTLISYVLTPKGSPQAGLINCMISLSAIGITTYLALKIEAAKEAVREAREQLTHISRVTTLGELAASIAHEINQPLGAIVTSGDACLRWLSAKPPNLEETRDSVQQIVNDADRASKVIGRIRHLTKRTPPRMEWLSIGELVSEIISLSRIEVQKNHISIRTQLSDDLPLVLGDRVQLQQVLLNLIVNGIEAIVAAGQGPRELVISAAVAETKGVLVGVSDTGMGIEPGRGDHLFDAFYTTKPDGMGMGLAISRSIVEHHSGQIWVTPNVPRGAVLQFTLPTVREERLKSHDAL